MEVWTTAIVRATTVGPGIVSRTAWRHALSHWRTTLSPAAGANRSPSPEPTAAAASQPAVASAKENRTRREKPGLFMLRVVASVRKSLFVALAAAALSSGVGCATDRPPAEQGSFHKPELVELARLDSTIRLDIRYATADNIVHRPVYRQARAFLQRPAAEALVRANRALSEKGYGLLVFDGYRPWSVTKIFWDSVRPEQRAFVADPKKGSKHNRGCAVDLSLYDLATGREVEMPSAYDETSERASPDYTGGTGEQRARRDLLRSAMEKEGFTVEPNEWWHFNYKDWKEYPIRDIPFESIVP